jgi:hypothetical protein
LLKRPLIREFGHPPEESAGANMTGLEKRP